jgi:hypothetical protein
VCGEGGGGLIIAWLTNDESVSYIPEQ